MSNNKSWFQHFVDEFSDFILVLYSIFLFWVNWVLGIVMLAGVIFILVEARIEPAREKSEISTGDYIFVGALASLATILIYWKIHNIGWAGYLVSVISGLLVILLSLLILNEEYHANH